MVIRIKKRNNVDNYIHTRAEHGFGHNEGFVYASKSKEPPWWRRGKAVNR